MAALLRVLDGCAGFFSDPGLDVASYEQGEVGLILLYGLFAEVAGYVDGYSPYQGVFEPVVHKLAWHRILVLVFEVHVEYTGWKRLLRFPNTIPYGKNET